QQTAYIDANGDSSSNSYNSNTGELLSSTDAMGFTTTYVWANGNRTSETSPYQGGTATTNYSYDAANRLTAVKPALKPATSYRYNARGDQTGASDGRGNPTSLTYNGRDEVTGTQDANGDPTSATYFA